ncbi:MAG: DHHA1 domain-containing protein [Candidatus Hodarchaeaceae archaeon]|nr:DHHA1 domain-containing protein [Candidatus Hodarchaeaceae archaeon]
MGRAEIRRFQRAAEEAAAFLKPRLDGNVHIKVISHTDADGIAAAAILARCLYFYNVPFSIIFSRPMSSDQISELAKEDHDMFIFVDQGSAQIETIHKSILSKKRDVLVIDHHPGEFPEHPNLAYINPHTCGLNGAKDVSSSGAVYSIVEQLDLRFRSLAGLAVVGAIGDRQEFFSGFTGANDTLVKRAVDLGLLYQSEGLRLVGRTLSPVVECLRSSTRPYIVGLSGNLAACRSLVDTLGIPHSSLLSELGFEVERRLADGIFARVGPLATNEEFAHTLWGTLYAIATADLVGPRDLREYAALLDACGNLQKPEIGFAVAAGDQVAQADALAILSSRQEQMLKALAWLVKKLGSFKLTSTFRYLYCGDDIDPAMMGEALSLAIESGLIPTDQPVLALANMAGGLKISARSTPGLAMQGIDIGRALAKTAADVGGYGGGHDVAAAARIPRERMDEFIAKLDQTLSGGGG